MYKKVLFVLIILSSFFFYLYESPALTIGPARFEVKLPAGEIAVADYYAYNETEIPVHVTVEPENWFAEAYNYEGLAIEDWIQFDIYEFDLKPKEIKKMQLTIKVPPEAAGELVAQIFFSSAVTGEKGEQTGGGIRARLGAVLYVAIKGTEIIDAEIRNINLSKVTTPDKEKLKINVVVRNKGNVHLRPTGKVVIEGTDGEKPVELDLMPGMALLPGKYDSYHAFWEDSKLKKGKYKVSATVNYGKLFDEEKRATFEKAFEINKKGEMIQK